MKSLHQLLSYSLLILILNGFGASLTTATAATTITDLSGLTAISVTPQHGIVKVGESLQLKATGTFQDGSTHDITTLVSWLAYGATVDTNGVLTGQVTGSVAVAAYDLNTPNVGGATIITIAKYGTEGTSAQPVSVSAGTIHTGEVNRGGGNTPPYSYYNLATTSGSTYYIRLKNLTANANLEVFGNSDFSNSLCVSENYNNTEELCVIIASSDTGLFIRVDGTDTNFSSDYGAAYDLSVVKGYSNQGSFENGVPLSLNTPLNSEVGLGSSVFSLPVAFSGKYTITVSGLQEEARLLVLTKQSVVVCDSYHSGLTDESCSFQADISEVVIIVSSEYSTQVIGTPFTITATEDHGAYSNEGSVTSPVSVTAGSVYAGQVANTSSYYSAAVTANKSYTVSLTGLDASTVLYVYDGDSTYTTVSCNSGYGNTDRICKIEPATSNTLYIKVNGNEFGADYTLSVSEIVYAAEGTLASPKVITTAPSVYTSPYSGQVDSVGSYYQMTVDNNALYHVALKNLSGDIAFSVYADATLSTLLCESNNAGLADESCTTASLTTSNEIYIVVTGSIYGSRFDMTVDRVYGPQGTSAAPIDVTDQLPTFSGEVGPTTDVTQQSFYQVSLTAGKTYRFTVSNYTHEDVALQVFDGVPDDYYYNSVCLAAYYSGNYSCTVSPITSSVVTLKVRAVNTNFGAAFSITVDEVDYQQEGSIASPVDIGSYPVPSYIYSEKYRNDALLYNGQSHSGSSYYVADISGGYDYVGYRAALTNQGSDANIYIYEDASYSIELCSSINGSNTDESCAFTTASNKIYIRVDGSPSGFGALYTIDIDHDYNSEGGLLTGKGKKKKGIGAVQFDIDTVYQGQAISGGPGYYKIPVTPGITYNVNLTNIFNPSCIYIYPSDDGTFSTSYGSTYSSHKGLADKSFTITPTVSLLHIEVISCSYPVTDGTAYSLTVSPN